MLVLERRIDQRLVIQCGDVIIKIVLVDVRGGNKARIGVDAPRDVIVHRQEVWDEIQLEGLKAWSFAAS